MSASPSACGFLIHPLLARLGAWCSRDGFPALLLRSHRRTPAAKTVSNPVTGADSAAGPRAEETSPASPRPGPDDDGELVRRIRNGETDLFEQLVRKYESRIYSLTLRIIGNPQDAEEVANDAFVAAFRKLEGFREEARFYSWLYRIAANQALNRIKYRERRKRHREQSMEQMIEERGDQALAALGAGDEPDPREKRTEAEWQELIEEAIRGLPPVFRTVVVLRDIEGKAYGEIAELAGIELGTVRSRLHKGRSLLRDALKKYL